MEFLCDASSRQFYFMEVNTRLQVEHLVSQCINHQIDLVELQIRVFFYLLFLTRLHKEKPFQKLACPIIFLLRKLQEYYPQSIRKVETVETMQWNVVFTMKIQTSISYYCIIK